MEQEVCQGLAACRGCGTDRAREVIHKERRGQELVCPAKKDRESETPLSEAPINRSSMAEPAAQFHTEPTLVRTTLADDQSCIKVFTKLSPWR